MQRLWLDCFHKYLMEIRLERYEIAVYVTALVCLLFIDTRFFGSFGNFELEYWIGGI